MKCYFEQDNVKYEFDAASPSAVFDKLAAIESVAMERCGLCDSQEVVREKFMAKSGSEIRKLKCKSCGAQLDIAVSKSSGMLFVGRKDKDGNVKGTRGWDIWSGQQNSAYSQPVGNADAFGESEQSTLEKGDDKSIPF